MKFDHWLDNGSTERVREFVHPDSDIEKTLVYRVEKPERVTNLSCISNIGEPITFAWTENPNLSVAYQVWRKVKGIDGSSRLITTLGHGTSNWTDQEYSLANQYIDLLTYDIRSIYGPNGTTADPMTYNLFGQTLWKKGKSISAKPQDWEIGNYPNPFNPSTTIAYSVVEDAEISIVIADLMGRSIMDLVHQPHTPGYYSIEWNGRDFAGKSVASGVYFYSLCAKPIQGNAVTMKSGKLMLSK